MNKDKVLFAELSGAQVHDFKMAQPMMQILNTRSMDRFVADRGYDDDKLRTWLNGLNINADIPPRKNRKEEKFYDKLIYRERRRIENMFAKIKENRRLALRVDKLDTSFMGFLVLAFIKMEVC
jgi:transposase